MAFMTIVGYAKFITNFTLDFKGEIMKNEIISAYAIHIKDSLIMTFICFPGFFLAAFGAVLMKNINADLTEKMVKKTDNVFNKMIENYYDSKFKILEIKHPDWFEKA